MARAIAKAETAIKSGEILEPEYSECKITCPFCHAPWSDENMRAYDLDAGDHCESGRFYAECCTVEIHCAKCKRLMYRKEGFELR